MTSKSLEVVIVPISDKEELHCDNQIENWDLLKFQIAKVILNQITNLADINTENHAMLDFISYLRNSENALPYDFLLPFEKEMIKLD